VLGEDDFPEDDELGGFHHMGGTRMATSPARGIVDRNCKVFEQDNLYVAGSSVFPSGGHANPTLTIIQLALRLGDHLVQTAA
jgi:choline dehydrogenase-like flavoprotein